MPARALPMHVSSALCRVGLFSFLPVVFAVVFVCSLFLVRLFLVVGVSCVVNGESVACLCRVGDFGVFQNFFV